MKKQTQRKDLKEGKHLHVILPEELWQKIDDDKREQEVSKAYLIESILRKYYYGKE